MTPTGRVPFEQIERLTHRDPGRRRLPASQPDGRYLDRGQLQQAAESLLAASSVAIVTGFAIGAVDPPTAETDGPPGALYLARALLELGKPVELVTDCYAAEILRVGCKCWHLPPEIVVEAPWSPGESGSDSRCARWCASARNERGWSHLVAIERPGPAHDLESIAAQHGATAADVEEFRLRVPEADWNACHNMRGRVIDPTTAPLHLLFEGAAGGKCPLITIGMADGGNEIGMGRLAWRQVQNALEEPAAARIVCRVATDWLLLAGVSNWAAYGLGAALCALAGRRELLAQWTIDGHGRLIETLVREGGAVDGTTGARQPSVDGLSLAEYLPLLDSIQQLFLNRSS